MIRIPEVFHNGTWIRPEAWDAGVGDDWVPLVWWHGETQEIADPGKWRWIEDTVASRTINGLQGFPLKARDEKGREHIYYCNHGICPYWDYCQVRLTNRIKDIHTRCPLKE